MWANPFKVSNGVTRENAIDSFEQYLLSNRELLQLIPNLSGKRLVCHCSESQECHADVIIDAFRAFLAVGGGVEHRGGDDRSIDKHHILPHVHVDGDGDDVRRPLFVETFAGSASLSKAVEDYDFDVVAVDWNKNTHVTKLFYC